MLTNGGDVKESIDGNIGSIATSVGSAKALKSMTGKMDPMSPTNPGTEDSLPVLDATERQTLLIKKLEQVSMT